MASYHVNRRGRASRLFFTVLVLVLLAGVGVYYKTVVMPRSSRADTAKPQPSAQTAAKPPQSATPMAVVDATASRNLVTPPAAADPTKPVAPSTKPAMPAAPTGPALPSGSSNALLANAKAKSDAGDVMGARKILNDALVSDRLNDTDGDAVRAAIAALNAKIIFSPARFADDPYIAIETMDGRTLPAIARAHSIPWESICRVNGVSDRKIRAGQSLKVPNGPFHVMVTKHAFRLDIYLGGLPPEPNAMFVASLPVGLGKDDSTPTGLWMIQRGSKGKGLDWTNPRTNEHFAGADPKNPLGGFWIGLRGEGGNAVGKQSYGIHGTIEPDSIGRQASMGCVRLRHDDIAFVYDVVTEEKTRVMVRE